MQTRTTKRYWHYVAFSPL